jgi:2-polyprenyl-3-methyl-5-hydroxy-6-metoxy-1,4-benzoquinol methylase
MTLPDQVTAAPASVDAAARRGVCPVCGRRAFALYREVRSRLAQVPTGLDRGPYIHARVERCEGCRLFRTVHLSDARSAEALYTVKSVCFDASASKVALAGLRSASSTDELSLIPVPPPARLFEVGCGGGQLLLRARARGYLVEGIDLDPRAVAFAGEQLGLPVRNIPLEALAPEERYDVIVLFGVLEHVAEPRGMLVRLRDHLAPGGALVIGVPNAASLNRRVSRLSRHDWDMFLEPGHLYHYDIRTLGALAVAAGLALVRWRTATITIRGKIPPLPVRWPRLEGAVRQLVQRWSLAERGYVAALRALDVVRGGDMLFAVFRRADGR